MTFDALADELNRQEFARLKAAQTPRIEAFCSMTRGGFLDEIASMMERLDHAPIAVSPEIVTVKDGRKYLTHCANPADRGPVKMPAIRRLHQAVGAASAFKGIYVTPRSFTPEAEHYAAHAPITLVDGRLLIKSMQLSRKGVLLPQSYKAMCRQCGDIVQHSLAKDDQAEACINGHLVAPTISRAALIPYRPPTPAAGEQPAAPASHRFRPGDQTTRHEPQGPASARDQDPQSQVPRAHDPAAADTGKARMNHRERQRIREREQRAASVAAYITKCDDALHIELERTGGEWPDSMTVPFWPGSIERAAFVRWLDEVRAKSGKQIGVEFDPPSFRSVTTGAVTQLH